MPVFEPSQTGDSQAFSPVAASMAATLPGWSRFEGAEDWLKRQPQAQRDQFDQFVAAKRPGASPEDREQLFKDYVQWRNAQGSN